jgi:pimeloyl-ACP methyl ester carboxylesterase
MPFVKINNLNTYYEIHGDGELIVLLHNGFSCTKMWDEISPLLVAAGFQVLMFDRRGYGQSDGGPDFEAHYNSDVFRDEAVAVMFALLDHLGIEGSFHILGQCEGGVVGTDFSVRYPDKVKTVSTASTLCYSEITLEEINRIKFPPTYNDLPTDIQHKYVHWHGAERAEWFYTLCSRYGGCYGRDLFDLRPQLAKVQCPSLVMYPDRGHFFEAEQGVAFFRSLPLGELAIFPKCGHNIFEHYPELYAQTVIDFIGRVENGIKHA